MKHFSIYLLGIAIAVFVVMGFIRSDHSLETDEQICIAEPSSEQLLTPLIDKIESPKDSARLLRKDYWFWHWQSPLLPHAGVEKPQKNRTENTSAKRHSMINQTPTVRPSTQNIKSTIASRYDLLGGCAC